MMRGDRDSEEEEPELTPKMSHSKVHCMIDHVKQVAWCLPTYGRHVISLVKHIIHYDVMLA